SPGAPSWDKRVDHVIGLFGKPNLSDENRISIAWLEGPRRWILLYGRPAGVILRLGTALWNWSGEGKIIASEDPDTGHLYSEPFSKSRTHPYGPSIIKRFTEWNPDTCTLGVYFLISLSGGYQVHLMRTYLRIDDDAIDIFMAALAGAED